MYIYIYMIIIAARIKYRHCSCYCLLLCFVFLLDDTQKQPLEVFCQKFHKFHRKTPALKSLFNKVASLQLY